MLKSVLSENCTIFGFKNLLGQDILHNGLELIGASKIELLVGARYTQIHEYVAHNDLRMEKWNIEYRALEAAWIEARHPPNTFPSFLKWMNQWVSMIEETQGN